MRRTPSGPSGTAAGFGIARHAFLILLLLSSSAIARAAPQELTETGSTLMLPLIQHWAQAYGEVAPDTRVTTAATGSGAGIAAIIDGTAQIGASDAYMSDLEVARHSGILNIPLTISAQTVNYNLPGLTATLRLSGPVLAGIYSGSIRDWSDAAIAALNPGTALPHHTIVPIRDRMRRATHSSSPLSFSAPDWEHGPGFGTLVRWPDVPGALAAMGNEGMVQTLSHTPYGVAYIGGSCPTRSSRRSSGRRRCKMTTASSCCQRHKRSPPRPHPSPHARQLTSG